MTTPEDTELREKLILIRYPDGIEPPNGSAINEMVRHAQEKQIDRLMNLITLHTQKAELEVNGNTSDGYHTLNELYEYRMQYNAALFNEWALQKKYKVHKSWYHADEPNKPIFGGGWFIVMAELPTGQISNLYESHDWEEFQIPETPTAHAFDGHTPQEALDRIAQLTNPTEAGEL